MIISTTPGKSYAVTTAVDCTVTTPEGVLIANCSAGGQSIIVAPTAEIVVSDDSAIVTESFKGAPAGLSAAGGSGHFDSVIVTGNAIVQGAMKLGPKGAWIKGVTDREIGMDILTVYTNASVNNLYNTGKGEFSGPATFSKGVTMGQTLTVEGQTILTGGLHVEGDLALYGADGLPGGHVCGYYGSPDESTIIIKDAGAMEYMGISYNSNISQASLDLRGNAAYLALPENLVGPAKFYAPDHDYILFGINYDHATGYSVGTDFPFFAYGGMDVASGVVFHSGVTMDQSLNLSGKATLNNGCDIGPSNQLKIYASGPTGYISSTYGELVFRSDTDAYTVYFRGMTSAATVDITKPHAATLNDESVLNRSEGDARWAKVRTDLTDAQYAALTEKDATTFYIASDTGKIYLGTHAFN